VSVGKDSYFASSKSEDLCSYLSDHTKNFRQEMSACGLWDRMIESHRFYYGYHWSGYGTGGSTSFIGRTGVQGQLKLLAVNHYRNLLTHMLNMTVNQKPSFDPRAINSDLASLRQARIGGSILDGYLQEKRMARYLKNAAEAGLVYSKGFAYLPWDVFAGRVIGVKDGPIGSDGQPKKIPQYEGDVDCSSPSPFDVYYDYTLDDFRKIPWVLVVRYENKWELKARYPEKSVEIDGLPSRATFEGSQSLTPYDRNVDSDLVAVFHFYHLRTDAVPTGRAFIGGPGVTLSDGPLPYGDPKTKGKLPVFRINPSEALGTTEGYTHGFDLLSINKAYNVAISSIFTNVQAHGVSKILMPSTGDIAVQQLSEGLACIKYNPNAAGGAKPEALNLLGTPKELYDFLALCEKLAETISGVNSVARGNPDSNLKSGVALGLVQSMAIQFASGFQQSWVELLEDVGTFVLIDNLAKHANNSRVVQLAGKKNRSAVKEFTKNDLQGIASVAVNIGNPLTRTYAGRVDIGDKLMDKGLLKSPEAYIELIETGNLTQAIEDDSALEEYVRWENEELMEGKPAKAIVGERHLFHAQRHLRITENPELRAAAAAGDPEATRVLENVFAHVQDHMNLRATQNPMFAQLSGEAPPPMPPPDAGPPQGGQGSDMDLPPPPQPGAVPAGTPLPPDAEVNVAPPGAA